MRKNILVILIMAILIGSASNVFAGFNRNAKNQSKDKLKIGLLNFTGDTSKVNQNSVRSAMAEHLNSKGFSASSGDERGKFQYFIGVEIKSSGKSELTVIITLYGKDKSVIKQISKSKGGVNDDSIRPMVLKGLDDLASKIR